MVSFLQLLVSKTMVLSPWEAVSTLCFTSGLLRVSQLLLTAGTWGLAGWLAGLLACLAVSRLLVCLCTA